MADLDKAEGRLLRFDSIDMRLFLAEKMRRDENRDCI
jgi:hypothetical protein